jgi:hypothetical protein
MRKRMTMVMLLREKRGCSNSELMNDTYERTLSTRGICNKNYLRREGIFGNSFAHFINFIKDVRFEPRLLSRLSEHSATVPLGVGTWVYIYSSYRQFGEKNYLSSEWVS